MQKVSLSKVIKQLKVKEYELVEDEISWNAIPEDFGIDEARVCEDAEYRDAVAYMEAVSPNDIPQEIYETNAKYRAAIAVVLSPPAETRKLNAQLAEMTKHIAAMTQQQTEIVDSFLHNLEKSPSPKQKKDEKKDEKKRLKVTSSLKRSMLAKQTESGMSRRKQIQKKKAEFDSGLIVGSLVGKGALKDKTRSQ